MNSTHVYSVQKLCGLKGNKSYIIVQDNLETKKIAKAYKSYFEKKYKNNKYKIAVHKTVNKWA